MFCNRSVGNEIAKYSKEEEQIARAAIMNMKHSKVTTTCLMIGRSEQSSHTFYHITPY
ncbi:MAG: hypothetical protein CM15mV125_250 [uncultured marine virus]|nr:MAG: hypothetical protein CM15mV125_250 [uncultured marine virus]